MQNLTIVSACDRNFIWGAWLLAASAARCIPEVQLQILETGFTAADRQLITQFPPARLLPLEDNDPRSVANRKSEALLSADTDFVAWLDADCFVIGDIRKYLIPTNGIFQIRLRGPEENAQVWRHHYTTGDTRGELPRTVAERWRADVGQLETPQIQSACVTNCFVIHRDYLDIVREWKTQIAKVIPARDAGPVDKSDPAYFMTDESVFTSLLAFSRAAPPISDLMLNKDPTAHVAHFGANPKPWKRWRKQTWYCRRHVLDTIDWALQNGYATPPLPASFRRSNALPARLMIGVLELKAWAKFLAGKVIRRM
jgi:hypothetical protein